MSEVDKTNSEYNREFLKELRRRTKTPLSDLTFIFYLVFGVVLFSGFGVFVEIVKYWFSGSPLDVQGLQGVRAALAVFYPALIGAASLQLTLEAVKNSKTLMAVFAISSLLIMLIAAAVLGIQEFRQEGPKHIFSLSFILSLFGLWIWTVANADNPDLKTKPKPEDAVGGSVTRKLPGSTTGFTE
ncbi:hypothetical protein [Breoghania sp. L-A4]|uniref:hypothetical protein n=1 Tax=Breoghania sp. L-A4 TaxID=2304600 RepID=UPI000E35EA81|nr:hypothetical protein [Breoghania sp. L-A4]AXS40168.1 hypothetical protein D1F64_08965 [Breoghania sp. L-A4]